MSAAAPVASLKLVEAQERARLLRVDRTLIELDLTGEDSTFSSVTTIDFRCSEPRAETFLDFKGAELVSVTLNERPLDRSTWHAGRISLSDLQATNTVRVEGVMAYASDGEGLHRHVDPTDGRTYLYAMSFLDAGPKWFACFDQPDLKSAYELDVRAPVEWTVLGNGPSELLGPGHWRLVPTAPLSTYFVTLVAGPYASVHGEHDGIRLGFHVRASLAEFLTNEAPDLLAVTSACFDYYHRVFGVRYPFGEYHQAFVPDFNAGAMENPGCVTLRDSFIYRARATDAERATRAGVVAHEMAHMWFGDLVTMAWWDDLWLNESFAEFLAHRCCTESTRYSLWTEFGILRKDWGAVADQSPSTHPVAGNGSQDAAAALQDFDGISYAKGAAVLKQLAAYLGEGTFLDGLRDYFARHRFANASFVDLIGAWTRAGAVDLESWAAGWLRTSGMDTLTAAGSRLLRRSPDAARRPHAVAVGYFDAAGTGLGEQLVRLTGEEFGLELPTGTALVFPDVDDDTWARIRFGEAGWSTVAAAVAAARPATRVVFANAVRDAVRAAELDPVEALGLVADLVPNEPADVVLTSMLRFVCRQLAGPYAAPGVREDRLRRARSVVDGLLAEAPAGSDRQLSAFRAAILSSTDHDELRGWLDGRGLPTGVRLDPELAWAAVTRLAALSADPEPIERQLQADGSAAGRVHAARARATLADSAGKAAAWELLVNPNDVPAYELYATAEGFFHPGQDELTAPWVSRYFADIPDTASFRSGWVLGQLTLTAYPAPHSTGEVLAQAERCLQRGDLAAAVRRALLDATDQLRRAVRSRERYA